MVINACNIVVAFLISYFRYGEKLTGILVIGTFCIFVGMIIIILETKKSKKIEIKMDINMERS